MQNLQPLNSHDVLGEAFIAPLQEKLVPLEAFTLDLSPEVSVKGASVSIPLLSGGNLTATDKTDSYANYTTNDITLSTVQVVLSKNWTRQIPFSDVDISKMGGAQNALRNMVRPNAQAIGKAIQTQVLGVITDANFPAEFTSTAANFTYAKLVDLVAEAKTKNFDDEMAVVLPPAYVATLKKDSAFTATVRPAGAGDPVISGVVGEVAGAKIYEMTSLSANTSASDFVGFICNPGAIAIALRPVAAVEAPVYRRNEIIMGENGAAITYSEFVNVLNGALYARWSVLAGVAVGDSSRLIRIVTT